MFKGLKGLGDLGSIMKQAQEMQAKAAEMQDKLDEIEVEGQAGAGMVKARCTGKGRMTGLSVDPQLLSPDEAEVLEDLVVAAVNDAQTKAQERAQEEMGKLTEGMPLPTGMEGMFR